MASVTIPSGYRTGRCWQTGRTREQTVVLLLAAGRQLPGKVLVISITTPVVDRDSTVDDLKAPVPVTKVQCAGREDPQPHQALPQGKIKHTDKTEPRIGCQLFAEYTRYRRDAPDFSYVAPDSRSQTFNLTQTITLCKLESAIRYQTPTAQIHNTQPSLAKHQCNNGMPTILG